MAIWIVVYIVGAVVMMAIQSMVNPSQSIAQDKQQKREYDMGVVVSVVAWPVFLPMVAIMWMQSCSEASSDRKRRDEWRKKCGRT